MRKKRSGIAFILAIALVLGMLPASVAAVSIDAQNMASLGLLRGVDGGGVNDAYPAMGTERYQAVVIMARLMGIEAQLNQTDPNAENFTDTAGKSEYVRRVMAFAKANPQLGFVGFPDGSFGALDQATAQQIYKVLLVSNGYVENHDFNWGQVFDFSATKGMSRLHGRGAITNDQLATALTEGLRSRSADGVNTLGSLLVARGVISQSQAAAAGVFLGYEDGTFRPDNTATRYELVTALVRYLLGGENPTEEMWADIELRFNDVPGGHWALPFVLLASEGYTEPLEEEHTLVNMNTRSHYCPVYRYSIVW